MGLKKWEEKEEMGGGQKSHEQDWMRMLHMAALSLVALESGGQRLFINGLR